jgi:hypothetical protein
MIVSAGARDLSTRPCRKFSLSWGYRRLFDVNKPRGSSLSIRELLQPPDKPFEFRSVDSKIKQIRWRWGRCCAAILFASIPATLSWSGVRGQ